MIVFHFSIEGNILFSILMVSVMYLHCSMQEENILEHTNIKFHLCTFMKNARNIMGTRGTLEWHLGLVVP